MQLVEEVIQACFRQDLNRFAEDAKPPFDVLIACFRNV